MPCWQGLEFLGRVLESLLAQETAIPWDFLAVDSGSTDGTWELLGEYARREPERMRRKRIDQMEFDHGDTRNLLAAESSGELLVFLTQDAIPAAPDWLETLAANFTADSVAAACCRNVPRPDAAAVTKLLSVGDPGYAEQRREVRLVDVPDYAALGPHERRLLYNFNDVASAIRRSVWELHPFPRTPFGEDILMARALLEAGHTVVYDAQARVEHSHDYDPHEVRARARIDGEFNAQWLDRVCVAAKADIKTLCARLAKEDDASIAALGLAQKDADDLASQAAALRRAAFTGLYEGGRTDLRRPATSMLERRHLKILFVVHGFPPDTWAGTEIYTFNLAQELARRGHETVVLARVPAKPDAAGQEAPDFSVEETEFQGLRLLRLTHRLNHASLRESYDQPQAEAAFRRVLRAEQPDLVHFQHLIHTSAGLVAVAREAGLPTVITCHDYWAICPRVQLIRPDGELCPKNMGAGCFLCVKEQGLKHVAAAAKLGRATGPALELVARALKGTDTSPGSRSRIAAEFDDLMARRDFVEGAYAAADLRISPSRFLRQVLVESAGFDPHTFLFSDNGMRMDHIRALEKRPDEAGRVRFGFVGSLVWYKGDEVMIEAMEYLAGSAAVLNIYGDFRPEEDEHHRALAKRAGDNVVFKGRFDNARLSEVYAQIDVLVVPSVWYENSPITIHEAFLTGTPVMASNIGGMAEYVNDGVDGLHFKVGDARDLAHNMSRCVDEPELIGELSRNFMEIKTIEQNAAETEFRYRSLVSVERQGAGAGPRTLLDCCARDAVLREGPVEEQGADMLLLRPGGGALEFALDGELCGELELRVGIFALAAEANVEHGGRVLVDGVQLATLERVRAGAEDGLLWQSLSVVLPEGASRLRLECALAEGGPEAHLRLKQLSLVEVPGDGVLPAAGGGA
jgi:glycosyltransferase involved in cell wall biosynthesis